MSIHFPITLHTAVEWIHVSWDQHSHGRFDVSHTQQLGIFLAKYKKPGKNTLIVTMINYVKHLILGLFTRLHVLITPTQPPPPVFDARFRDAAGWDN